MDQNESILYHCDIFRHNKTASRVIKSLERQLLFLLLLQAVLVLELLYTAASVSKLLLACKEWVAFRADVADATISQTSVFSTPSNQN